MPLSTVRFTRTAFTGALSRVPTDPELSAWTASLDSKIDTPGPLLAEAQTRVASLFEGAEYLALATTNPEYVEDLYLSFLGHVGDEAGQLAWEAAVAADGRSAVLVAFKVSTEFAARVASLYAEASTSVPAFPTEELGGPHPSKRRALPPDYKSLVTKHTYADKGISTNTTGDVPPLRFEEDYSDSVLDEWEVDILRAHYNAARHDELTFDYTGPDGILRTGVRYESYEDDFEKTWIQRAKIMLVKYPS
jgi:hypothetical protein